MVNLAVNLPVPMKGNTDTGKTFEETSTADGKLWFHEFSFFGRFLHTLSKAQLLAYEMLSTFSISLVR